MVIYADLVLFINSFIDFFLLYLTAYIRKQDINFKRLVIASLLGGIYSILHLYTIASFIYSFSFKVLVSFVLIYVAFGFKHLVAFFRNILVFYVVCFLTGGVVIGLSYLLKKDLKVLDGSYLFTSPVTFSWFFVFLAFPLVFFYIRFFFNFLKERTTIYNFLTKVRVYINGEVIECTGLIDTANQLKDPLTRKPVIVVEYDLLASKLPKKICEVIFKKDFKKENINILKELDDGWLKRFRIIPYKAAFKDKGLILALRPDKVEIFKDNTWHILEEVFISIDGGLSSDGSYKAIIHSSCVF